MNEGKKITGEYIALIPSHGNTRDNGGAFIPMRNSPRSMVSSIAPSTSSTSAINAPENSGFLPCCRTAALTSCAASSTSHAKPLRNVVELHLVPMKKFLATPGTIGDRIPANFSSE